jgi:hypothetical protein
MIEARWRDDDLWLASVSVGGNLDRSAVHWILSGARTPTPSEFGVLAVALNERLGELATPAAPRAGPSSPVDARP